MAEPITQDRLRSLAELRPERGLVLSVFLNLDPTQFATAAARSTAITSVMTAAAHKVEEATDVSHEDRMALREDVARVRDVLESSDVAANGTRAVAVYANGPSDLLEVVALRAPVESRVVLDRTPCVEPLVHQGTSERWMVLLCNRRVARFFAGPGDDLEETERLVDLVYSQHKQGGWSQARYQRGVEKEKDDHIVNTADIAFKAYKREGVDRLLIGAPEELVGEIEEKLHPYLRERIVGRLGLDVENSSLEDVRKAAGHALADLARRREREALDRLAAGVGRGGRGAAGLDEVLSALNEARVETLLVNDGFRAPGRIDRETGMLHADGGSEGEAVQDIVEPAIEKALEQSAKTIVVRHHDDLGPLGGIGAVLRY
ncbi:MAG TPA: Vms1/Ankzf1 family peptidyl-tRNA hydrolase [Solirubrobacteraceae bacterium]|jgi:peptide subunit release factor 1 (eRF1)